ncbi:MAG: hypothetical protein GY708_01795 [Actinomycetia bacterium]|nr:hypothetical protein [Actinomycetes bacterium]MCP4960977.1 hypothetical protein [Actinomycetes bacterium]
MKRPRQLAIIAAALVASTTIVSAIADRADATTPSVAVVGDSVILGAGTEMNDRFDADFDFTFDAAESRSTLTGASIVGSLTNTEVDVLVVALGHNDAGNADIFRARAQALLDAANARNIIWLTMRRDPRNTFDYTPANQVLRELAASDGRMTVTDWDSTARDSNLTWDGLHLTGAGAALMTDLVESAIEAALTTDPTATCRPQTNPAPATNVATGDGYWILDNAGEIHPVGEVEHHGDLITQSTGSFPASMRATPSGDGYWIVDENGEVHTFGDAEFKGDMRAVELNAPIRRLETPESQSGYWLVAADGGVFAFGVEFHGSTGAIVLKAPVISLASTADGLGYWLVASDGGVFTFGTSRFHGSTGAMTLNAAVIDMAVRPDGTYWLYAHDGGVFSFGAPFLGSVPGLGLCQLPETVAMRVSSTGDGYWLAAADGRVFAFGDAADLGGVELPDGRTVVDMATS